MDIPIEIVAQLANVSVAQGYFDLFYQSRGTLGRGRPDISAFETAGLLRRQERQGHAPFSSASLLPSIRCWLHARQIDDEEKAHHLHTDIEGPTLV